ncbi:MAG: cysteine--tRNA ligase [Alphaproteobacteria bacterium]|nr:cysteine--tRNA ligase [Alphaproteobacteria bacterium]
MKLTLYDTAAREKRLFVPIDPRNVRLYVCGPTVYDFAHIGNARPVIVFDVLFRLLRHLYGEAHVTYVRNITDVDDKINARAAERGISIRQLTEETARIYQEDARALGCLDPTHQPRVTDHMGEIIAMIDRLIALGAAYVAEGHVLFSIEAKADYGKLARRSLDEMIAGARVDVAPYKKNPMDFVLWKPSTKELPGWESPWGRGRPGWHIECSAMSEKLLGDTFDIHGGGIDLVFPHHENEIAQSECAHRGRPLANYWMHNGFLQVEGEKMSKSLGNFFTIRDVLKDWPGEVVRLNMLRSHYRQPIDWTLKGLQESDRALATWAGDADIAGSGSQLAPTIAEALSDDLNTPAMIAGLHALHGEGDHARLASSLRALGFEKGDTLSRRRAQAIDAAVVETLLAARAAARKAKDFKEADRIRAELDALGVEIKDGPAGTTWDVKI